MNSISGIKRFLATSLVGSTPFCSTSSSVVEKSCALASVVHSYTIGINRLYSYVYMYLEYLWSSSGMTQEMCMVSKSRKGTYFFKLFLFTSLRENDRHKNIFLVQDRKK